MRRALSAGVAAGVAGVWFAGREFCDNSVSFELHASTAAPKAMVNISKMKIRIQMLLVSKPAGNLDYNVNGKIQSTRAGPRRTFPVNNIKAPRVCRPRAGSLVYDRNIPTAESHIYEICRLNP